MENKLKTALSDIKSGAPIEEASRDVDWKDFEGLVAEVLESKNFEVVRNFRMKKPTMEIDVVGIHLGTAVLIDCKHWKRMSNSALNEIVRKQVDRVRRYADEISDIMTVPVIVTLHQEQISFINKVPIVPIMQLSSFLDELYGNLEQIKPIEK